MTGHCKEPAHLEVNTRAPSDADLDINETVATYVASATCPNFPDYHGWVVVISYRLARPLNGLHLMPDACPFIADGLQEAATSQPALAPVIEHTLAGVFVPWASFTTAGAYDLAARIRAAVPR